MPKLVETFADKIVPEGKRACLFSTTAMTRP